MNKAQSESSNRNHQPEDASACSDYYWRMFQENCEHGRHHESQRQGVTNLILVLTGAAITVIAHDGIEQEDRWLASFIVFLGIFGAAFSLKCYERFKLHMARAGESLKRLEEANPGLELSTIPRDAEKAHTGPATALSVIRLHWFWLAMHAFVIAIGVMLLRQSLNA